jgi:hypothetical protein
MARTIRLETAIPGPESQPLLARPARADMREEAPAAASLLA